MATIQSVQNTYAPLLNSSPTIKNDFSTGMPPTAHHAPPTQRFEELWSFQSRVQQAMLCSLSISKDNLWLASSSLDCNLLFIDFRTGQLAAVIDFESRFNATSLLWLTESLLYVGTDIGVLFAVYYTPGAKHPIVMRSIFKHFTSPVDVLALDPVQGFLALGSGGDTFIFSRPIVEEQDSWELVDHIPAPSSDLQGVVTSLAFYRTSLSDSQLFIGYAKQGFCVWRGPRNHQRMPYDAENGVCSVGSAAVSAAGNFISIVTLDHAIVLYPLTVNGLVVHERQVLQNENQEPGPLFLVPIALTENNVILRGTTSGAVPIIDLQTGPVSPILSGPKDIIRALVTSADKVVVGVSSPDGLGSLVKCYRDLATKAPAQIRPPKEGNRPVFEISIGELEERSGSYRTLDGLGFRKFDRVCKSFFVHTVSGLVARLRSRRTWTLLGWIWVLMTILVIDPPQPLGKANNTHGYSSHTAPPEPPLTSEMTSLSRAQTTEYPTLSFLATYCALYIASRFVWWGTWCLGCVGYLLALTFKTFIWTASVVPRTIRGTMTVLPQFISAGVCEVLLAFGDVPFCPKPEGYTERYY